MGSVEEHPETWELLNEELRHRLDVQRSSAERLETKAALVLGAALTAIQFVAREAVRSGWLSWAVAAYVGAMACAVLVVVPRRFEELKPRSLIVGLWLYERGRSTAELANNRLVAFETNVRRQGRRMWLVRASIVLLVVGAILSAEHLARGVRTNAGQSP